jgi:hypothetical protein
MIGKAFSNSLLRLLVMGGMSWVCVSDLIGADPADSRTDTNAPVGSVSNRAPAITTTNVVSNSAEPTNAVNSLKWFAIIQERNIFSPARTPGRRTDGPRPPAPKIQKVDTLALVGTLSYTKGSFAFFDGSSAEYRKPIRVSDSIAGYTLKSVKDNEVNLEKNGKPLSLKVGSHLRRVEDGEWESVAGPAPTSTPAASEKSGSGDSSTEASSGDESDVLKRLLRKREQESKK